MTKGNLKTDISAIRERDPAARSDFEVKMNTYSKRAPHMRGSFTISIIQCPAPCRSKHLL